ncbi:MAG: hypothetical protein QGF74_02060 [Candidatus Nanoarchaeia archaeon]|jgi:lipopolysaccharide export LptBFGC system permease protein LptF|nr:hypothetical protein [Candidatus Nanoarchaeia archaeon]|tara:strand:- start:51669 stop:51836 length:168 start_codon:yes stop_codon:yes gene_type:complete
MKTPHSTFEIMFFLGLILIIVPFFIQKLFPMVLVLGLILMIISATRERLHLLKHK